MIQKPKRPPGRPRAFDPGQALDRALRVFWAKGYDGASLDDLTAAMGISRPSMYAAFGDKQQLFLRCLERYGESVGTRALAALSSPTDIHAAVRAFLRRSVENFCGQSDPAGCLAGSVALAVDDPTVRAFVAAGLRRTEALLADRLARAVAAKELPPDFPSVRRARRLLDASMSLALRARSGETLDVILEDAEDLASLVLAEAPPSGLG